MHTEVGKKIVLVENSDTQSSLLSPQSCSFLSQSSPLTPHHLFADVCVGLLNQGQSVRFKANGWSMHPTICDGEMINVEPVLASQVRYGDIILYRSLRGITAHRVIHIQKEMEPHGQTSDPIQSPMWGDISGLASGQAVLTGCIPSSAGANSALSSQSSVKLLGHWVIRLLGHFWMSLSPNSRRRTPNVSNHRSIALCPMRHALCVSFDCPSPLVPRPSTLIFYTRGDSLMSDDLPVMSDQILGKVLSVERNGQTIALYGIRAIITQETRLFLSTLKRCVVSMLSELNTIFT